ncbi:hypothetical protein R1sor_027081 [Riccia sorocarpa]|uniref:GDSL esterase/lipase n=1 Tax=Riccia sorocarpa TaxID=122646 RepID=A0ABD3GD87_9MARC
MYSARAALEIGNLPQRKPRRFQRVLSTHMGQSIVRSGSFRGATRDEQAQVVWMLSFVASACVAQAEEEQQLSVTCPPALFSFGTSLSDTGNRDFVYPDNTFADLRPYGSTFPGHPDCRFSDGRLIVDFFASAFGFPFIEPIITNDELDYTHGVNLAFSGAWTIPQGLPYFFDVQVDEFAVFRGRALSRAAYQSYVPTLKSFDDGLYIVFFGRNDFTNSYWQQQMSPAEAQETLVPKVLEAIVDGIKRLYDEGAWNFMVFNVNPQGCQPQYLTLFGDLDAERDENGCLASYNRVIRVFNSRLLEAVRTLRAELNGSTVFHADFYGICKEVFDSPQDFGFSPEKTLTSCCGTGGRYKYDPIARCGYRGMWKGEFVDVTTPCEKPSDYVSWDGVHFTEAFYNHAAKRLLTGKFLDPPVDLSKTCNLDFKSFELSQPQHSST